MINCNLALYRYLYMKYSGTNAHVIYMLHLIAIPMCPCSCAFKEKLKYWKRRNITKEELLKEMQPFMKEVQNDIKMDKSKISAAIRKRTSAPDDRKSAEQIGTLGIVLIVGAFVMITLFDILTCVRFCSRRNRVANY